MNTKDPLLANSSQGLARMKQDRRLSDFGPSHVPQKEQTGDVKRSLIRFSQSSIGSGFSSPKPDSKNVPLAVSLRSANPLSVLTEGPGSGKSVPKALTVRNEDEGTLTTFDHRRIVNASLHAPDAPVSARVVDKSLIPPREFGKYSTRTRGKTIDVLAPGETDRRSLGKLSVSSGPDDKLKANTNKALSHMINRHTVLRELTFKAGNKADFDRHTTRVEEYSTRQKTFNKNFPTQLKSKL